MARESEVETEGVAKTKTFDNLKKEKQCVVSGGWRSRGGGVDNKR